MKSAFGIKLERDKAGDFRGEKPTGESVSFWREGQGWCGGLNCGGFVISETIGSSSPEACYRSLRGRAGNLVVALRELGVKA